MVAAWVSESGRKRYRQSVQTGRVVVAEEDPGLRRMLADRLTSEGYEVRVIEAPCRLGEQLNDFDADLVVSAISADGPTIESVREKSNVLFVALMPRDTGILEALDVVDAGADDVLVKPFSPRELITKMHALLRRENARLRIDRRRSFEDLVIDIDAREVVVRGEVVELPAREFDLLVFLSSAPRQVFSRAQILAGVWGVYDGSGTATVTEHVRRLRGRIEADPANPRWIQTVWSVGYRFVA
jgi:DNA-binding response OmpR family regulator